MSIAAASEADLANIIYIFGEERHSRAVARAIVAARKRSADRHHARRWPISSRRWCAASPAKFIRRRGRFRALRIFVNAELDELHLALSAAERVLKPGGRLVVVSFHSLEDRIVKNFFAERGKAGGGSRHLPEMAQAAAEFCDPDQAAGRRRPMTEIAANPRARSAKLRAGRTHRCAGACRQRRCRHWPTLADVMRGG